MDVVEDELDDVEDGVQTRPVQLFVVANIPLVLRVVIVQVQRFINEAHLVDQLARRGELDPKLVWQDDKENLLELLFEQQVVLLFRPGLAQPLRFVLSEKLLERVQIVVQKEVPQLDAAALAVSDVAPLVVRRALLELADDPEDNDEAQRDERDDEEREKEHDKSDRGGLLVFPVD